MTLENIATYQVTPKTQVIVAKGKILDFSSDKDAAIVNVTNMGCLGGGGVDTEISRAGGERLLSARLSLPVVDGETIRCVVGDAKLTGPASFGRIGTNHVIHTVGPNYHEYDDYNDGDELLMSSYGASLEVAAEGKLEQVAFSLISVDSLHRAKRSLKQVLAIAIHSCGSWAQERPDTTVQKIYLVATIDKEAEKLVGCAKKLGLVSEEDKAAGVAPPVAPSPGEGDEEAKPPAGEA